MTFEDLMPENKKSVEILQETIKKFCGLSQKSWVNEDSYSDLNVDSYSVILYIRLSTMRIRLLIASLKILGYNVEILEMFDLVVPARFSAVINLYVYDDEPVSIYIGFHKKSKLWEEY